MSNDPVPGNARFPLQPLQFSESRSVIIALFASADAGSVRRKLTGAEIIARTRLPQSTVHLNMWTLSESGWFCLDWQDGVDVYDKSHPALVRRLFLADGVINALRWCLNDFEPVCAEDRNARVWYEPTVLPGGSVEVKRIGRKGGRPIADYLTPERRAVLSHCGQRPQRQHLASEVAGALGIDRSVARMRLSACAADGWFTSELVKVLGTRDQRAYTLTEVGLALVDQVFATQQESVGRG